MRKQTILWGLLVTGCLLGIFGQPIAYFLSELFGYGWPLHYLTILTVNSYIMLLFVVGISVREKLGILLTSTLIAGGMISIWSFFILAMWWG